MKMQNSVRVLTVMALVILLAGVSGCRGYRSEKSPIHLNPNMDFQSKFKAQALALKSPDGTVAWGKTSQLDKNAKRQDYLRANTAVYEGKTASGKWVAKVPINVTEALLNRGQDRFDIYCAVCHDRAGTGRGMVVQRGFVPPPNLGESRVVAYSDGELFDIVSNGIRTMPAHRKQIPVHDRWAIVTYVRALQAAQNGRLEDVPQSLRQDIQ